MLKGKSFWSVGIPQNCFWNRRKILKLRNIVKWILKFKFGNGGEYSSFGEIIF